MKCRARGCENEFVQHNTLHNRCYACLAATAKKERERKQRDNAKTERKAHREAKERIKTRSQWVKDAQINAFNPWVRQRDILQPCISCGRYDHEIDDSLRGGKWDCGHYLSVGAHPELRFEPLNAHKQCKSCNGGSGKYARKNHTVAMEYRVRLIDRIGLEKVEWLEGPHEPKNYAIDDLREIKTMYSALRRSLR